MKIPSLFRTPQYQRFNVEPRYYDPVKEQIEERQSRIRKTLEADKNIDPEFEYGKSSIQGSFSRYKTSKSSSTSLVQLLIMVLLSGLIFGYMYLGNVAVYMVIIISSVLLYLKVKRIL